MHNSLPALDFSRSPYTGWTRAHWEYILARMTCGYVQAAERKGSPARVLYPDDRRGLPDAVDAIESFARIASAWGAWLHNPSNPATIDYEDSKIDIEALLHQALLDGTDPSKLHTYWGDIDHMDQRIVESADIAVTLWLSRERVFNKMSASEQAQVIAWLAQVDGKGTYTDNWILFTAMAQAVRHHLGFPAPLDDLDQRLMQIGEFYRGDGWYVDGPSDEFELYNAWMFGWHYLLWTWIDGERRPDHRQQVLGRAQSFISGFQYFFGSNGSYPAWGRSIVYRFAALAPFALGHFLGIAPQDPGLLRRISSGCIRYFYDHGMFDPENFICQGFHGDFPPAGEAYISPGSPYWCCHGLFALALDQDDPFWTAVESPLPVEREDFDLVLSGPGFLLSGHKATGQVLLLNSRSGQEYDAPRHNYTSKYGKLVYSTHFPFNVLPVQGSYAPDAMISLTRDGKIFGHRLHTRAGEVAPGFMWSRFDQMLDGEPQPIWVAVLLCGDVQIRLEVIRPTFPVMAFEAPGALGCEQPPKITRRSDLREGWEYAEVDGRAVAIRRLAGYDCQRASAPFLDQSNINLAYTYAEQPLVYESSASVAARCLATAALVRPASFDPQEEFAGLSVEVETGEVFRVSQSGERLARIAPGESPLRHTTLAGIDMDGPAIRFVQMTADRNEFSGLGVTRLAGIADFSAPAAFRLSRTAAGQIRLTTDQGISLSKDWIEAAQRIEVHCLDDRWQDVSNDCRQGSIPAEVITEWQVRNQRNLLEFWINR